jgi:hypothetical protein
MVAPKQKKQCQPVPEKSDIAGRKARIDDNRRGREHEYGCHLGGVDIHEIGYQRSCKRNHAEVGWLVRRGTEHNDNRRSHRRGRKEHCKEQEPASEKHCGEEAIFSLTQPITQHADEP